MQTHFSFKNYSFRYAEESDIPKLRQLINAAYKELADMGLNYTATYQDEQITRNRIAEGQAFILEIEGKIMGTVLLKKENWFTEKNSAYVCQLAVTPDAKKQGLGSVLMDLCEHLAKEQGFETIQLDTAKPAGHLVQWYIKRGYQIVGEAKWEGKSYESWIFEKPLLDAP